MNAQLCLRSLPLLLMGLLLCRCAPKESVLIVQVKDWPEGATKLRVLPAFTGQAKPAGQTFFVEPETAEFSIYFPPGLAGQAVVEGMVQDSGGCYVAGQIVRTDFTEQPSIQRVELVLTLYAQKQCAWQADPPPSGLAKVWTDRPDNAWTVGNDRTVLRWDGNVWLSVDAGTGEDLNGVWGSSSGDIWVVGMNGLIRRWNGSVWTNTFSRTTKFLSAIWGSSDSDIWVVGDYGTILRWNGSAWMDVSSSTTNPLRGVWGTGPSNIWAVGDADCIRYWDGSTWSAPKGIPNPPDAPNWAGKRFQAVYGSDAENVWIVTAGAYGHILRLRQGTWTLDYDGFRTKTIGSLYGVWAADAQTVWAVGDQGNLSWDGSTWAPYLMRNHTLAGVAGTDPFNAWAVGNKFPMPNSVSAIHRWNGTIWSELPNPL